jgi:hypothetical protein
MRVIQASSKRKYCAQDAAADSAAVAGEEGAWSSLWHEFLEETAAGCGPTEGGRE